MFNGSKGSIRCSLHGASTFPQKDDWLYRMILLEKNMNNAVICPFFLQVYMMLQLLPLGTNGGSKSSWSSWYPVLAMILST